MVSWEGYEYTDLFRSWISFKQTNNQKKFLNFECNAFLGLMLLMFKKVLLSSYKKCTAGLSILHFIFSYLFKLRDYIILLCIISYHFCRHHLDAFWIASFWFFSYFSPVNVCRDSLIKNFGFKEFKAALHRDLEGSILKWLPRLLKEAKRTNLRK